MKCALIGLGSILLTIGTDAFHVRAQTSPAAVLASSNPIADWSLEAQRAIVPPPGGIGDKFPGEAAVYMGIVHAAMYDVAVAVHGGYNPYAIALRPAANTAPAAAIASAAYSVLVALLPTQAADLNGRYAEYLSRLPTDDVAKTNGIALGERVAAAILATRANDGRTADIQPAQPLFAPGLFQPDLTRPVLGFRLSRIRPLALESPDQFRSGPPHGLDSKEHATDLEEVRRFGRIDSDVRTVEQTNTAIFWMDHDVDQWNKALLRLAVDRGLDVIQTARMLALAHVSGGDAMIACFDAKYHYSSWRPVTALMAADEKEHLRADSHAAWRPLRATPNHPEYPAAHTCHAGAIVEALHAFFGNKEVRITLDSRTTEMTRSFNRLDDVVREVEDARVFAGFHFRSSNVAGSRLGRDVARFVAARRFGRVADPRSSHRP